MIIAVFDDHQIIIDALSDYLSKQEGVESILSASRSTDFIELIQQNKVDIIISDVLTDEGLGLEMFEHIKKLELSIPIVVYSRIHSDFVKNALLDLGVVAFVNKKEKMDQLWEIVKSNYLSKPDVIASNSEILPHLTDKEKEIVRFLAQGLVAKEIAHHLGTSVNTVNNQKNNLIEKFKCNNSVELILRLTQLGYINL